MNIVFRKSSLLSGQNLILSGSKSESNRLLILQQLFPELKITNLSNSDDVQAMQLGLSSTTDVIDVHHAGTTMRFLTAYYALCSDRIVELTGSLRMQERPIAILVDALRQLGAQITYQKKEGFPPLCIHGCKAQGGKVVLPADISSQYISALLLVGSKLPQGITLELIGDITSRPYIEMTLQLLQQLGCSTSFEGNIVQVNPINIPNQIEFTVESDWSSASYFYGLIALGEIGDELTLAYFKQDSLQGDALIATYFKQFGVETTFHTDYSINLKKVRNAVSCFEANLVETPDLAQTIAVTCFGLGILCKLTGLHTLKIKETDRLVALKKELSKFGAEVRITDNSLELTATGSLKTAIAVDTYQDHRMAMAFAILSLKTSLTINEAEVVSKSFVDFWDCFSALQFDFDVIE
ncbi:MAG: 3-phosphoshikimate 1-carboxyvinyltransferase [Flavobacteriaceae bacterium]|jgi:3-phosphoshikimate 1-carboxyvinyltransferase|nr:3-phosphoshikimate 1-carboxyvinyltransferase [Flavobacteriaceae bacterium]